MYVFAVAVWRNIRVMCLLASMTNLTVVFLVDSTIDMPD